MALKSPKTLLPMEPVFLPNMNIRILVNDWKDKRIKEWEQMKVGTRPPN